MNKIELEPLYLCPLCSGDGKETCSNPDHGFLSMISFRGANESACPCCGHDENHKIQNGGICEVCKGCGMITKLEFDQFCVDYNYDEDPRMILDGTDFSKSV